MHTGVPFGAYRTATRSGRALFGVPVVIAFAWTMLAWPAALAARRLRRILRRRASLVGAWALAAWDLFLDPQMVAAGHWRWPTRRAPARRAARPAQRLRRLAAVVAA